MNPQPVSARSKAGLFNLEGKTVLLTGPCGYLGRCFTRGLLEAGATVVMASHSPRADQERIAYEAEFGPSRIRAVHVDFYDRKALQAVMDDVLRQHDIDVLVNNAYDISAKTGFNTPHGTLEASTFDQWMAAFESGIYWAVRLTQLVGMQMRRRGGGSIVNISSMYGVVSPDLRMYEGTTFFNPPSYSVVKAGLLAFTRYVASAWASYHIRCNALVPGPFSNTDDDSYNAVSATNPFLTRVASRTLVGRVGRPPELLGALLLLASDASSYMTGQTIIVDGGWTVT